MRLQEIPHTADDGSARQEPDPAGPPLFRIIGNPRRRVDESAWRRRLPAVYPWSPAKGHTVGNHRGARTAAPGRPPGRHHPAQPCGSGKRNAGGHELTPTDDDFTVSARHLPESAFSAGGANCSAAAMKRFFYLSMIYPETSTDPRQPR